MADVEPQPAKKQCLKHEYCLPLPEGVIIPPFYTEERDASMVSSALRLGAEAVLHLQRQAEALAAKELSTQAMSEMEKRIECLEDDLSRARQEVEHEVQRRVSADRVAAEQKLELCKRDHAEEIARLVKTRDELDHLRSASLDDLMKQNETIRQLHDEMRTIRDDERQKTNSDAQHTREILQSQEGRLNALCDSLVTEFDMWQQLFSKALRLAQDRYQSASSTHAKGVLGELDLATLIRNAFGMVEDFELRDTRKPGKMADFMVRIWGLQTMWDSKNYSSNVDITQIKKMQDDLLRNPGVDVAFLVSLRTNIANHGNRIFDVEIRPSRQALVYVNSLMNYNDPVKLLQVFARPLFTALRQVKQAHAQYEANSWATFVKEWTTKVSDQLTDLQAQRKELEEEEKQQKNRFTGRRKQLDMRENAITALLTEMCPMPSGSVKSKAR